MRRNREADELLRRLAGAAELTLRRRDTSTAVSELARAAELGVGAATALDRARAHAALARALHRDGRPEEAAQQMTVARERFTRLGHSRSSTGAPPTRRCSGSPLPPDGRSRCSG